VDSLKFALRGYPGRCQGDRAQQVLKRSSFEGFVRQTPGTEAIHYRAVRSPQRGCVRVAGQVEAVAFEQLGWSVSSPHALLNVARRLLNPHPYSPESLEGLFCVLRPRRLLLTQRAGNRKNIPNWEHSSLR
jgi:hypothetical protein